MQIHLCNIHANIQEKDVLVKTQALTPIFARPRVTLHIPQQAPGRASLPLPAPHPPSSPAALALFSLSSRRARLHQLKIDVVQIIAVLPRRIRDEILVRGGRRRAVKWFIKKRKDSGFSLFWRIHERNLVLMELRGKPAGRGTCRIGQAEENFLIFYQFSWIRLEMGVA